MMSPRPPDDRTVRLHRQYPDPIDTVWSALTESDRLAGWIGSYTGAGRPHGTVEFTMTGEADAGGEVAPPVTVTIVECAPPGNGGATARLVVDVPEPAESTERTWRLAVTLTDQAGGTGLVFEQQVPPGLDPADIEAGWSWYLDRLGAALRGGPMPVWADYAPTG
jgi:uncharacterized protein YndB with AHSA1/START domain